MFNLIFELYKKLSTFNFSTFFITKILFYLSVFQFINIMILFIIFISYILYFLYTKYRVKTVLVLKSLFKKAIVGFFITLLICLISDQTYFNNLLNISICENILNTDLKKTIAITFIVFIGGVAIYKIGSLWYNQTILNSNSYKHKKQKFIDDINNNKILENKFLNEITAYNNNFFKYKNDLILYNQNIKLKQEGEILLLEYNKKVSINKFIEDTHTEILIKFYNFNKIRNLFLEDSSNKYKHIYIFKNSLKDLKDNKTIDNPLNNLELMHRGLVNISNSKRMPITSNIVKKINTLKEERAFQEDILSLLNKISLLELETHFNNPFQKLVNISPEDLQYKLMQDVIHFSKSRINNINDSYIFDRIKSVETLLTFTKITNKFSIDFIKVNQLKTIVINKMNDVNESYMQLCKSSLALNNFVGSESEFDILLKKNYLQIDSHNLVWRSFLTSIDSYNIYFKSIKTEALILPEISVTLNMKEPIEPIKPQEPIYNINFKLLEDIPKIDIDITGSYLLGLKFATINLGYTVLYPTFFILNFFLGVGNPIPSELFYESLKYFYKLKMFYGK